MSFTGDIPADAAAHLPRPDSAWLDDQTRTIQAELLATIVMSFRHETLNTIDRLALLVSETSYLLDRGAVTQARETLSEIGDELQELSEAVRALKLSPAPLRDAATPLGVVWADLSKALATRIRRAGIKIELDRPETFDPLLPGPIVAALTHLVVDGIVPLQGHRRSPRLLVQASPEHRVGARLRVVDSVVRASEVGGELTMRLVSALVSHCDGTCETRYDRSGRTVVLTFDVARGVD